MQLRSLRAIVPLVVVACAGIVLAACGGSGGYGGSSSSNTPAGGAATTAPSAGGAPTTAPSSGGAPAPAMTVMIIEGAGDPNTAWKFDPASITVKTGDTVAFMDMGQETHTATADDGSFDTHAIDAGTQKTVTFDKAGTFTYHCSFHPWMKGTITVTAAGAAAAPAATSPAASGASNTSAGAAAAATPDYSGGYGY